MRSTRTRNRKLTCTKQDARRASEKEMQNFCDVMKTSEMYAMEMHFEAAAPPALHNPLK